MSRTPKLFAILAFLSLALTGCTDDLWGQGGPATPSPEAELLASSTDDDGRGGPADNDEDDEDGGRGGPADGSEDGAVDDADVDIPEPLPVVGTVILNWDIAGVSSRYFTYDATVCSIDAGKITVEGTGSEDDTGAPSTLDISVTPANLEHAGTKTYLGAGHIKFTADDSEIVGDGRVHTTPEGYHGPSMFHYRYDDNSSDFRSAWWLGAGDVGAGAIKINCDA